MTINLNNPADKPTVTIMNSYTTFNINENVAVRLTDYGREVHKENHETFWKGIGKEMEYHPPVEDENGWSQWQLWSLMQKFGPCIYMGRPMPFETTIRIENKEKEL